LTAVVRSNKSLRIPPVAVIEILSPEDTLTRMLTKLRDYEQMGIQTILVLDPEGEHYRFSRSALQPLTDTSFALPGSSAHFDLEGIRQLLD
jgi:Uma2 family endonuclease